MGGSQGKVTYRSRKKCIYQSTKGITGLSVRVVVGQKYLGNATMQPLTALFSEGTEPEVQCALNYFLSVEAPVIEPAVWVTGTPTVRLPSRPQGGFVPFSKHLLAGYEYRLEGASFPWRL